MSKIHRIFITIFLFPALLVMGCSKDNTPDNNQPDNSQNKKIPLVMIHGMLASGDTWAKHSTLYIANGYTPEMLYAYDWNTLGGNNADNLEKLDQMVSRALNDHKAEKVHLIGHSAGGGLAYSYMSNADRARKVAAYVHIGSSAQSTLPGPDKNIPVLNIYSKADKIVNGADIPGAQNAVFENLDHYEVATDVSTFESIYSFLNEGKKPARLQAVKTTSPTIAGRVVTLGENKPEKDVTVRIFRANPADGTPAGAALATLQPDEEGYFRNVRLSSSEPYIFEVTAPRQDFRTLYYYRQPFDSSNPLVYLRTFPPAGSIAGLLLANLPKDDRQSVVAVFSAPKAVIHGRDNLTVNGTELSTAQLCAPQNSVIAMFVYDNGDQSSSGAGHPAFALFPFLRGADVFLPAAGSQSTEILLNGKKLKVKNYKSASEGVIIAVFD
ncbi:MAG: alpha/beta fold hydrolase [Saprospiraceae bacterium]|nr:alpha/beta fold hydrolase [Saprospiraceae bacterium]